MIRRPVAAARPAEQPTPLTRARTQLRLAGNEPASPPLAGPWPRAVEQFEDAVSCFHADADDCPDQILRRELLRVGETLDSCLADLQAARRSGAHPDREASVVADTDRAADLCLRCGEAARTAGEQAARRELDEVVRSVDAIRTFASTIRRLADTCMIYR